MKRCVRRFRRRLAIVAFAGLIVGMQPASAAEPGSLDGEMFDGTAVTTAGVDCDFTGPSPSFSYHAEGPATGPYPGGFVEDGTVMANDSDEVVGWTAQFTITDASGTVVVSGEKHWVDGTSTSNGGYCDGFFFGLGSGYGSAEGLAYTAQTPTGTDTGLSSAEVQANRPGATFPGELQESYTSTGFTPGDGGSGGSTEECRAEEKQRHKEAEKAENDAHHDNEKSEKERHREALDAVKSLPKAEQKAARDAENEQHRSNKEAEEERHREAKGAEDEQHRENLAAC